MRIRSRLLTRLFALLAVALARLLFRTCRVRTIAEAPGINPYESTGDARFLFCVWHDQIVMTVFTGQPHDMAGLVSAHQDGSYLAEAMKLVAIKAVRGSSKRGGSKAMRHLLDQVRDRHVAITPGGPGHFGMIFMPGTYRRTRQIIAALEAKLAEYPGDEDLANGECWL